MVYKAAYSTESSLDLSIEECQGRNMTFRVSEMGLRFRHIRSTKWRHSSDNVWPGVLTLASFFRSAVPEWHIAASVQSVRRVFQTYSGLVRRYVSGDADCRVESSRGVGDRTILANDVRPRSAPRRRCQRPYSRRQSREATRLRRHRRQTSSADH